MPSTLNHSLFVLDLKTDIDLKRGHASAAIDRLLGQYRIMPNNQVVVVNLASAYNETAQFDKAIKVLNNYLNKKPNDVLALSLLEYAQS